MRRSARCGPMLLFCTELVTPVPARYKSAESTAEPNVETDLCAERPEPQPPRDPRAGDLRPSNPRRRETPLRGAGVGVGARSRVPPIEPRRRADRLDPGGPCKRLRPGDQPGRLWPHLGGDPGCAQD